MPPSHASIMVQFLAESLVLAGVGGLVGIATGTAIAAAFARSQGWSVAIPPAALGAGLLAAFVVGGLAGLYPAARAARVSPSEALRTG